MTGNAADQHRPAPTMRNWNEPSSRRSARPDMSTTVHTRRDTAQREKSHFRFKALHGQSEQYLARGVNTNRPSRLQFAQSATNAEVFLVAEQGRVCRRVRGIHCGTFFYWARSWNTESPESFRQKSDRFLGSSGR